MVAGPRTGEALAGNERRHLALKTEQEKTLPSRDTGYTPELVLRAGRACVCSQEEHGSFCFEGVRSSPLPFDLNAGTARDVALLREIDKILFLLHPSTDLALRPRFSVCFHPEIHLQTHVRSCSWAAMWNFCHCSANRPCLAGNTQTDANVLVSVNYPLKTDNQFWSALKEIAWSMFYSISLPKSCRSEPMP